MVYQKSPELNNIKIVRDGVTVSGKGLALMFKTYFLSVYDDLTSLDLVSLLVC